VKSDVDSEVRDSVERENSKTVESAHTKVGLDAERLRSSIAKLTSSSTNELDKLIIELEALMQRMNRTDDELWRAPKIQIRSRGLFINSLNWMRMIQTTST
jgi:hypothetical protein